MKALLRSGFLALAIMALAVPANAGPIEDGWAAAQRGDYETALKFWRPLAELGHARAKFNLGVMYGLGEGVPQDFVRAYLWFDIAAAQGDKTAQKSRDIIASRLTPDQIAEAQHMALEWRARHKGDADAQLQIGIKGDRQDLPASDGPTPYIKPKPKTVKTIRVGSDGKPIPE